MSEFFDRKLHFITGKGGVGKSTLTAALARSAAATGKKALVVELNTLPMAVAYLRGGVNDDPEGVPLPGGVFAINLDPFRILEEFIVHHLRVKTIYSKVLNSRGYRYFTAAAPGLKELMLLGKIQRLVNGDDAVAGEKGFDIVFVDSPATGHGVSMFQLPELLKKTFNIGILSEKSEQILALLGDEETTVLHVATLPEEMPANEAVDLYGRIRRTTGIATGSLFINRIFPDRFDDDEREAIVSAAGGGRGLRSGDAAPVLDAALYAVARNRLERVYIERLRKEVPMNRVELPMLFFEDPADIVDRLGEILPAGVEAGSASGEGSVEPGTLTEQEQPG